MNKRKLKFAKALMKKKLDIFPLKENAKVPVATGWQTEGVNDVKKWANGLDLNIGVICGMLTAGWQMLVVDIDMKHGVDGEAAWKALGIEESLFQVKTPTGGRHLYYIVPVGISLGNSAGKIAEGVDIRCNGGYVVGPGSIIDGVEYEVINTGQPMLEAPQELIDLCSKKRSRVTDHDVPVGELDTEENIESAKAYLGVAHASIEGAGGDATAFAVAARVRELGISEEECLDLMLDEWNARCVPAWSGEELAVKVGNAYKYSSAKIGGDTPEAQFADEPDSEPVEKRPLTSVERYNQEHALVTLGGGHVITHTYVDDDGKLIVLLHNEPTFHKLKVADVYYDDDGKKHSRSKEWINSPDRLTYLGLTFDPRRVGPINRKYNQWRGFTYDVVGGMSLEEAKSGCDKYLKHIRDVVCGGRIEEYLWIINFLAHLIQKPWKKPETAMVIVGEKGTGKSLVFDVMGSLMKENYVVTAEKRMLLGNFNSHMERALLFQFEEAFWAGDKNAEGKLKHIVTGKEHMIERKGYEPYMVKNYARICITSNTTWVVPATVDERRWAVFACSDERRGDKKYFKDIFDQLEDGGYGALMTYLAHRDIDQTLVHVPPKTDALGEQKIESMDDVEEWLLTRLQEGVMGGDFNEDWSRTIETREVYDDYAAHVKGRGFRYPQTNFLFGKRLHKILGKEVCVKQKSTGGKRVRVYQFSDLETCREAFKKRIGHDIEFYHSFGE